MERKLQLLADKQDRGFTLLELLLVLTVITIVSLISLTRWEFKSHGDKNIDVISAQLHSMRDQETVHINDNLYFNGNGNINHAQTIRYDNKTCIFQLGFGRFYCE